MKKIKPLNIQFADARSRIQSLISELKAEQKIAQNELKRIKIQLMTGGINSRISSSSDDRFSEEEIKDLQVQQEELEKDIKRYKKEISELNTERKSKSY